MFFCDLVKKSLYRRHRSCLERTFRKLTFNLSLHKENISTLSLQLFVLKCNGLLFWTLVVLSYTHIPFYYNYVQSLLSVCITSIKQIKNNYIPLEYEFLDNEDIIRFAVFDRFWFVRKIRQ